jgi:hypothetical protein
MRREPPLSSAPAPRIDPTDRILQPPIPAASFAPPPEMSPLDSVPAVPQAAPAAPAGLTRDDLRKLNAALHELAECRKLLNAATVPEI